LKTQHEFTIAVDEAAKRHLFPANARLGL
jgi:hypothetical protein